MTQARIYQPAKNAMQSGRAHTGKWFLEFAPNDPKRLDPLMGWIGSQDTLGQIKLEFDSKDEAVTYAKKNNLKFTVQMSMKRRIRPKSYSANFAYERIDG
jgi:hypothetical protein